MKCIDSNCSMISNKVCYVLSKLCCPCGFLCKYLSKSFQRPYSFIFCVDFLILILPGLFALITMIQFHTVIISRNLQFPYYSTIAMITLNYSFSFIIYETYQEHYIPQDIKPKYSVTTFFKHLLNYLRLHKVLCLIICIIITEIIPLAIGLHSINTSDAKSYNTDYPIFNQVLLYGICCNLIFVIGHIVIYLILLLILLCSVNNTCLCLVCYNTQNHLVKEIHYDRLEAYLQCLLHLYHVFGLFDYKKFFWELEEESMAQNEEGASKT